MSRNLCSTECYYCRHAPKLVEVPRPITNDEAGVYFENYEGMLVANAECVCGALYLAWCSERTRKRWRDTAREGGEDGYCDLSFRSSFNDEPDVVDLPIWRVDQFGERCGLIEDPTTLSYWRADALKHPDEKYRTWVAGQQAAWLARREAARAARGAA